MKLTQSAIWFFYCVLVWLFHRGGVHKPHKPTASQIESKWRERTAPWASLIYNPINTDALGQKNKKTWSSWGGKPRNRETEMITKNHRTSKFTIPNITILREGINQSRNQNYRSFAEIEIDALTLKGSAHNYWNWKCIIFQNLNGLDARKAGHGSQFGDNVSP